MNDTEEKYPQPTNQDYLSYYVYQNEWKPTRPIGPIGAMSSSPGPAIVNLPTTIGEEMHDPTRPKAPGYKIGQRILANEGQRIGPGPGKYCIRDVTNKGPDTAIAPKFGKAKRFNDKLAGYGGSPGPAAYNRDAADKLIYHRAPTYSVPNAERAKTKKATTPAPNSYNLPPTLGPGKTPFSFEGPGYSFGKDERMRETKFDQNPGPARYMLPSTNVNMNKGPAYSMGIKTKPPKSALIGPGPSANSSHLVKYDKYSTPRITFGIRHSPYKVLPGFASEK